VTQRVVKAFHGVQAVEADPPEEIEQSAALRRDRSPEELREIYSRVLFRESRQDRVFAEVEGSSDHSIRSDLARAVIEAGWELHELRATAISLEEIFLQLTREESAPPPAEEAAPQETRP